ncbi:MAG: hypothetical protein WCW64_08925, partial [Phycisphaerae bacterium]
MNTKTLSIVLAMIISLTLTANVTNAKSVYAITNHGFGNGSGEPAKISSYDINSNQIDWQTTITLDEVNYPTGGGLGPVGVAMDSNSGYLFITHESMQGNCLGIQLIEASTMTDFGWIDAEDAIDLCGVVFDNGKNKLYAVDRGYDKLFVYSWNPQTQTLTLDGGAPKTLPNLYDTDGYGAGGIALDEADGILYVTKLEISGHSAVSNKVYCYSTEDWTFQKRIEITVDGNDRYATAAAIYNNGSSKYLFTGAFWDNTYLVRTDLTDTNNPDSYVEKNLGTGIGATGIAVDQQTGLIYVTASDNTIKVFNGLNFPSDPCYTETANIVGPAGICVPYASPIDVDIAITDNVSDCVFPNNDVNYTVEYAINQ